MLKPVTQRMTEESGDGVYRFTFYCDVCGNPKQSHPLLSETKGYEQFVDPADQEKERNDAYERANREAIRMFSRCPVCKKYVCDDCLIILDDANMYMCKECRAAVEEHGAGAATADAGDAVAEATADVVADAAADAVEEYDTGGATADTVDAGRMSIPRKRMVSLVAAVFLVVVIGAGAIIAIIRNSGNRLIEQDLTPLGVYVETDEADETE